MWWASIDLIGSEAWLSFQFTPPCGGGPAPFSRARGGQKFQFTPPCGGGLFNLENWRFGFRFQFTPPVWGRAANLHKCKVLFMCKMVETRDRINGKRWIVSKLVQYTSDRFVLLEQKHPGRYCANLPAYSVLPRSAQQLAYRRIGSPVCTRPVRPMVYMRV